MISPVGGFPILAGSSSGGGGGSPSKGTVENVNYADGFGKWVKSNIFLNESISDNLRDSRFYTVDDSGNIHAALNFLCPKTNESGYSAATIVTDQVVSYFGTNQYNNNTGAFFDMAGGEYFYFGSRDGFGVRTTTNVPIYAPTGSVSNPTALITWQSMRDYNPMIVAGDIIVASLGGFPVKLGIGSTGQVLTVSGGAPVWATPSQSGMTNPMIAVGDMIRGGTAGGPSRLIAGNTSDVLTIVGGLPVWQPNPGVSLSQQGLLIGANAFACNTTLGFSKRFIANKITAVGTGVVSKLSIAVYNVYGSRNICVALYDQAGNQLRTTGNQNIAVNQVSTLTFAITPVTLTAGSQYWIGVWADGVDIPSFVALTPNGSVFPNSYISIDNNAGVINTAPLTISGSYPFGGASNVIPVSCFN